MQTPGRLLVPLPSSNSKRQARPSLTRTGSGRLKQTKLSDLFAPKSPSPPLPKDLQQQPQAACSTPCCSSSNAAANDMDVDSTDSEGEDFDEPPSPRKRTTSASRFNATAAASSAPPRQLTRKLGFLSCNKTASAFYPRSKQILNPVSWHNAYATASGSTQAALCRKDYMASFKSHETQDQYFVQSVGDRFTAPPFACAFSQDAKKGGKPLLAVASEEGTIALINTLKTDQEGRADRKTLSVHDNAIFDLKWSADDRQIATASGDQTVKVTDVESGKVVTTLRGHLCTTKNVQWDPFSPHILASGSRDGHIRIWDTRDPSQLDIKEDVNLVQNAHGLYQKRPSKNRTAVRSVTSIAWDASKHNHIFSAGSADGVVKLWDLRRSLHRRVNPPPAQVSPDHEVLTSSAARSHGIASLALSPDSSTIYAMTMSNRIIAVDAHDLTRDYPVKVFEATPQAERTPLQGQSGAVFRVDSFYVRMSLSSNDNGRFLAAGSSDGSVWMWDTQTGNPKNDVCLKSQSKEVGGIDFGYDAVAACSDDLSVRLWRSNTSWQAQSWMGV